MPGSIKVGCVSYPATRMVKIPPGQRHVAGGPSVLTQRAFAQTGFQPGVLINHILLGGALVGD
ncbi:hypothetical protein RYZ40_24910, partial [Raoultella planticola]